MLKPCFHPNAIACVMCVAFGWKAGFSQSTTTSGCENALTMADEQGQLLVAISRKRPGPPWLVTVKRTTLTPPTRQSPTSKHSGTEDKHRQHTALLKPGFHYPNVALILHHFLYYFCHWLLIFVFNSIITSMARNSLLYADVPLRNYSLTHSEMWWGYSVLHRI